METVSLQVQFPVELLAFMRKSTGEMQEEVQHWIALELLRQRKISGGKAAELAGMPLADFMEMARVHQIEWTTLTDDELASEMTSALAISQKVRVH